MGGLNTEANRRRVPKGFYPQFLNLIGEGENLRPVGSDESYTPAAGDLFFYDSLGINSVEEVDFGEDDGELFVYAPYAGGDAQLRNAAGTEEDLAIPPPGVAPEFSNFARTLTGSGLPTGETGTYAAGYLGALTTGYGTGLSPVISVENDGWTLQHGVITGAQPSQGDTITNTTQGATATVHQSQYFGSVGAIVIRESEKSAAGAWENGDALTWSGGSTTMTADEFTENYSVGFTEPNETAPDDADKWQLFRLDDAGNWRSVNDAGHAIDGNPHYDNTFFPYSDQAQTEELTLYGGPVDQNGLVETLVAPPSAQFVAEHKGSIVLACGRYVYISETLQYRSFVQGRRIDAGADIVALVSRSDFLEIYTTETVKFLVGDYPNQYLRETGVTAGPAEPRHITPTPTGTFAFVPDDNDPAVYRLGARGWEPMTPGINTPWLRLITDPDNVVVGSGEGALYICNPTAHADGTYRALAYRWQRDEWREQTFAAHPLGFRYDEVNRVLAIRTATSTFSKLETASGNRDWVLELRATGGSQYSTPPELFFFDGDGQADLTLWKDGGVEYAAEIPPGFEERAIPLPEIQGLGFRYVLSGTGDKDDTEIRGTTTR